MPLANFFEKVSLGASQRLGNYDRSSFEGKLQSNRIGIVYGENCLGPSEGRAALDLAVRLLSRLYPNIIFVNLAEGDAGAAFTEELKKLATSINPVICFGDGQAPTINLVIGEVTGFAATRPCIYIGSDNWLAYLSASVPKACHDSNNPFGSGSAVCLGLANIFRFIFSEELGGAPLDSDFSFSAFSQRVNHEGDPNPHLPESIPLSFTLVGTGAIGNAFLWSLLGLREITGRVTLIDDQTVTLSNLQRYALMTQDHIGLSKTTIIEDLLKNYSALSVVALQEKWQAVANTLDREQTRLLVTAIDTAKERLEIQSLLPKAILNAWTSPLGIGVSRHFNFNEDVCLSCLYMPSQKGRSDSEKIAESLGNGALEQFIRMYLANGLLIDGGFVTEVSQGTGIDPQLLDPYIGQRVEILYSDGVCGGRVIQSGAGGQTPQDLEVPLAHESVLAGVLLGAEVVIRSMQLRDNPIEPLTKINMMQPMHEFLLEAENKHHSGLCICQDSIFTDRYAYKWPLDE